MGGMRKGLDYSLVKLTCGPCTWKCPFCEWTESMPVLYIMPWWELEVWFLVSTLSWPAMRCSDLLGIEKYFRHIHHTHILYYPCKYQVMQLAIERCSYKPSKIRSGRVRLALQPSKSSQQPTWKSSLLVEAWQKMGWSDGINMSSSKHLKYFIVN